MRRCSSSRNSQSFCCVVLVLKWLDEGRCLLRVGDAAPRLRTACPSSLPGVQDLLSNPLHNPCCRLVTGKLWGVMARGTPTSSDYEAGSQSAIGHRGHGRAGNRLRRDPVGRECPTPEGWVLRLRSALTMWLGVERRGCRQLSRKRASAR